MLNFTKSLFLILGLLPIIIPAYAQEDQYESFGKEITVESAIHYDQLLSALGGKDSLEAKVIGEISNVCQMKGCWMNIAENAGDEEALFVKFKDYGFFVPKDAAGKVVVVEGVAYRETTPVDELRHYAKDAGQTEEEIAKITDPKEEIRFVAKGVLIKK